MNNSLSREKQKLKIKRYLFVLSIIILPLINFIVFYLVQNFSSFIMAFQVKKETGFLKHCMNWQKKRLINWVRNWSLHRIMSI